MTLLRSRAAYDDPYKAAAVADGYANLWNVNRSPQLSPRLSPSPLPKASMSKLWLAPPAPAGPYEQDEYYELAPASPRVPAISSNKENYVEDGLLSPRRMVEQVNAFSSMCDAGADWGAAFVHALQGHKMTEEQAALCLQAHWRRHETVVNRIAQGLAAEHIQRHFLARAQWRYDTAQAVAQAALRGDMEREQNRVLYNEGCAATKINMAWRGHLARLLVREMRSKKNRGTLATVRRSLSFSKKARARSGSVSGETLPASPAIAGDPSKPSESVAKRVRRSLSFDRKGSGGGSSSSAGSKPSAEAISCTKRQFVLDRGPNGLGLELDKTNTVVAIKEGGMAERQGLMCVGDTVLTIDGASLSGKLMQDVMKLGRPVYVVEVSRPEVRVTSPPKAPSVIKRSLSFDRHGGGIKRSLSFDRKKSSWK